VKPLLNRVLKKIIRNMKFKENRRKLEKIFYAGNLKLFYNVKMS